jgi:hypothetical protein
MAGLRTLTLLLGALAVLLLGALPASAMVPAAPAPCHDMGPGTPDSRPDPDMPMKPMGCCVACVVVMAPAAPLRTTPRLPAPPRSVLRFLLPAGESVSPEPHPPRLIVS